MEEIGGDSVCFRLWGQKRCHIASYDIGLQIHATANLQVTQCSMVPRMGNDADGERLVRQFGYRQRDAIHCNGALFDQWKLLAWRPFQDDCPVARAALDCKNRGNDIHMSLNEMAAQPVAQPQCRLDVHLSAWAIFAEDGAFQGLMENIEGADGSRVSGDGLAAAVHCDAVS